VRQYNVDPLLLDVGDVASLKKAIVENEVTIVFFLIDAVRSTAQTVMIEALAEVHQRTNKTVHFLHTSGAKIFSSHAGRPVDEHFYDTGLKAYELQHSRRGQLAMVNQVSDQVIDMKVHGNK
jgi:hypothetical protein